MGALVAWFLVAGHRRARCAVALLQPIPTPAVEDRGDLCADVGEVRACWGTGLVGPDCNGTVCASVRPLPSGAAPAHGWRCDGMRQARICEDRGRNAGPWACDGGSCLQREPRLPDDGEWECVQMDGVAYCHGGLPAAGVVPSRPDLGWVCGARRGGTPGERVCVDFAPDHAAMSVPTRCRFEYPDPEPMLHCSPGDAKHVGDRCTTREQCPPGAACVGQRCLPPRPTPSCWFDADCGTGGRCRWATCVVGGP